MVVPPDCAAIERPSRLAITLEQCWHEVPGGTASSAIELAAALQRRADVDVVGVAARHTSAPLPPWTPPIPVRHLPLPRAALYASWHSLRWPAVQRATGPVDVVHATTFAIPPRRGTPLVVTVHDLAFAHEPTHFTKHGLRFFRRGLALTKRDADLIIVPSEATKRDCEAAGIDADRLRLVPHGVAVPPISDAAVDAFRAAHDLSRPYVLWCGTIEPRKNLPTLLAAFDKIRDDIDADLVLVGPSGWGDVAVPRDPKGRIKMLGFLETSDLHAAYAGAAVFCYPSLREGFGLPVLEAMAHGVPVVTSSGTSMAEFTGDAGLLVDPLDADAIAGALLKALGPDADRMRAAATEQASRYTWDRAADLTVAVYREVVA